MQQWLTRLLAAAWRTCLLVLCIPLLTTNADGKMCDSWQLPQIVLQKRRFRSKGYVQEENTQHSAGMKHSGTPMPVTSQDWLSSLTLTHSLAPQHGRMAALRPHVRGSFPPSSLPAAASISRGRGRPPLPAGLARVSPLGHMHSCRSSRCVAGRAVTRREHSRFRRCGATDVPSSLTPVSHSRPSVSHTPVIPSQITSTRLSFKCTPPSPPPLTCSQCRQHAESGKHPITNNLHSNFLKE